MSSDVNSITKRKERSNYFATATGRSSGQRPSTTWNDKIVASEYDTPLIDNSIYGKYAQVLNVFDLGSGWRFICRSTWNKFHFVLQAPVFSRVHVIRLRFVRVHKSVINDDISNFK